MKHSVAFALKQGAKTVKGEEGGEAEVYSAIASTSALDRDKEVLLPKGCIIEQFMKNPVMLRIHDHRHVSVGKVLEVRVDKDSVEFDFIFADTDDGKELQSLYDKGFMNAFSVGLYPKQYVWIDEDTPKKFEVEVADGSKQMIDLEKYKEMPWAVVNKWELLEISPVPVPSNPEALLLRAKDSVVRKYMGQGAGKSAVAQLLEHQFDARVKSLTRDLKDFMSDISDAEPSSIIEYEKTDTDKDMEWDSGVADSEVAVWASKGGTGEKEDMDWGKYATAFAQVNVAKADKFTSYKFLHHGVKDGELVAVWGGVAAAMSDLLGGKSRMEEGEAKAIYDHLSKHYEDFGEQAPDFDKDYSKEELEEITAGKTSGDGTGAAPAGDDVGAAGGDKGGDNGSSDDTSQLVKAALEDGFKNVEEALAEMATAQRVRMNVLIRSIGEIKEMLDAKPDNASSTREEAAAADPDKGAEDRDADGGMEEISSKLADLREMLQGVHGSGTTIQ